MKKLLLRAIATTVAVAMPAAFSPTAIAQRVTDVDPAINGQNIAPTASISGQFVAESGVEVDPGSVRILVNGRDVTSSSTITRNFFSYRPTQPLPAGPIQVQLEYRNTRGEQRTTAWTFTVQQPQPTVEIDSVVHSAAIAPQAPGENFVVTINGTAGAQASVLLIQESRTVREIQAREMSAGVYVATLTLRSGDRIVNDGVVVARLRRQGETTYAAAPQPVQFTATASTPDSTSPGTSTGATDTPTTALKPEFTSHEDGDTVSSSGFTLVGQTRPNATVQVDVTTAISVLDVVNLGGQTLVDEDVTANSSGEFRVNVPRTALPVPGTEYRVRAVAQSGSDTATTEITLRQR